MAGFRSLADHVRDPRVATQQRRTALRKCLEKFAPYGHRATWHHLCTRVGVGTSDRRPDPERLVAALAELEEARTEWLAYDVRFAERRRREKHAGMRQPGALDDWHRRTWGGYGVAWCDDPLRHPTSPLPVVVRRLVSALESEPRSVCPVCAEDGIDWFWGLGHHPGSAPVCTTCGIVVPEAVLTPDALMAARRSRRAALVS
ncbi:hypothetical protein [Streptomyces sp. NPDC048639]|uniref:hypothetical protein n=1 Tax=Streptomyces sp. NPDC048639 TaxID=3365581 RepID=UPI0037100F46